MYITDNNNIADEPSPNLTSSNDNAPNIVDTLEESSILKNISEEEIIHNDEFANANDITNQNQHNYYTTYDESSYKDNDTIKSTELTVYDEKSNSIMNDLYDKMYTFMNYALELPGIPLLAAKSAWLNSESTISGMLNAIYTGLTISAMTPYIMYNEHVSLGSEPMGIAMWNDLYGGYFATENSQIEVN